MFTSLKNDSCSIYDRDLRNQNIYESNFDQNYNFRKNSDVYDHVYKSNRGGIEKNVNIENGLYGMKELSNNCNAYSSQVQKNIVNLSPAYSNRLNDDLRPEYTREPKIINSCMLWEQDDIQKKIADWNFTPLPKGAAKYPLVQDRVYVDTRSLAKDRIALKNKQSRLNNYC